VQVYFCDPRSPWQRGSNENTNGLLRQYFPRGTDLSRFSQAYLNRIALRLINARERLWALKLLPIDYEQCCIDRLNPPLLADIPQRRYDIRFWGKADLEPGYFSSRATISTWAA
jgi:hypothetical protein